MTYTELVEQFALAIVRGKPPMTDSQLKYADEVMDYAEALAQELKLREAKRWEQGRP